MIRKFISYYRPHLWLFTLDMIAAVILAACNLVYPFIAKEMINDYAHRDTLKPIIMGAVLLLLVFTLTTQVAFLPSSVRRPK